MIKLILFLRRFKIIRECAPTLFGMSPEQIKGVRQAAKTLAKAGRTADEALEDIRKATEFLREKTRPVVENGG